MKLWGAVLLLSAISCKQVAPIPADTGDLHHPGDEPNRLYILEEESDGETTTEMGADA